MKLKMLNPIKIIEENSEGTVYEYNTIYLWVLYGILATIIAGILSNVNVLSVVGIALMLLYFFTVSLRYRKHGKEMKEATEKGSIQISGNKWSFSNPLRVTIPKAKKTEPGEGGNGIRRATS